LKNKQKKTQKKENFLADLMGKRKPTGPHALPLPLVITIFFRLLVLVTQHMAHKNMHVTVCVTHHTQPFLSTYPIAVAVLVCVSEWLYVCMYVFVWLFVCAMYVVKGEIFLFFYLFIFFHLTLN
jgi:hypothetical protein